MKFQHLSIVIRIICLVLILSSSLVYATTYGGYHLAPIYDQMPFMKSNSNGTITINYIVHYPHNSTMNTTFALYRSNLQNLQSLTSDDLTIQAKPETINLLENNTVEYTITAKNNIKGVFTIAAPFQCFRYPLIVGLNESEIPSSALFGLSLPIHCYEIPSDAPQIKIINYDGIILKNVTRTPDQFSPMEQIQLGSNSTDVQCKHGFDLIIKIHDNMPACVKPQTVQKLVEHGWALEINNPKLTHMNIKVFSSYTPSSLADHFLTGSLYSSAEAIQNGNITITVNGAIMGTTQTYPNGCFQFHNWTDSKLTDQINKSKSLGMSSMELNFQTQYFGDSNHNPANASVLSYLSFYAVPLAPAQYDTGVYPSNQINVTQGDSAQFHITVKPFSKYWEVGHMKLNLQRMPCGLSYHISPVDNNDSALVNNTASFDVVLNSASYTPLGKYWISIDQDLSGINEPNMDSNVGAFFLNVLKK